MPWFGAGVLTAHHVRLLTGVRALEFLDVELLHLQHRLEGYVRCKPQAR
jgi:hypothetical protein